MAREFTQIDMAVSFNKPAMGLNIPYFTEPCTMTPHVDVNYVYPVWGFDFFRLLSTSEHIWLAGPTGCGKSACVRRAAAQLNAGLIEVTGHSRLELSDLLGMYTLQTRQGETSPSMQWQDGPVTLAMREGHWLLINEIDLIPPETLAGLNTILDGSALTLPEHNSEVVQPAPGFRLIATANSNGAGDETGLYTGVQRQNIALMDRFVVIEASYIDNAVEKAILQNAAPSLPETVINTIIQVASDVRRIFSGNGNADETATLDVTMSVRTTLRWAKLCAMYPKEKRNGGPLHFCLNLALCNRASTASRTAIHEILQRYTGVSCN